MPEWRVPLADVEIGEPEINAVVDVYRSGWLSMGPRTEELESRFGGELRALTIAGHRPAHELLEAGVEADLIAVGSRATRGAHGLGSVSERVAHHAGCSVLVVRDPDRAQGS